MMTGVHGRICSRGYPPSPLPSVASDSKDEDDDDGDDNDASDDSDEDASSTDEMST